MLLSFDKLENEFGLKMEGVIHIGAHHGQEVSSYVEIDVDNVLLFEPQPNCFNILLNKFEGEDRVLVENLALGSSAGKMKMYTETANMGQSSSLLRPALHAQQYPHIIFDGQIEVDVTTLDKYFEDSGIDPSLYNTINIDVQGYELEVFKGADSTLDNIDYIITEINRAEVYEGCAKSEELDEFLGSKGFVRKITDWAGHTWGDAFYIKEN